MLGNVDIYTEEWCNMIFEGRNKEYGAFEDRKKSGKRHTLAVIIAVSVFTVGVSAPVLIKALGPVKKHSNVEVTALADIKLDKPIENKIEAPPPPPPPKAQVKFTPPEVTTEDVPDDIKPVDEIKETNKNIGLTDQDGVNENENVEADLKVVEEKEEPLQFVEQMPEPVGGMDALMKFLYANIKYPSIASEMGITGMVTLQFVVDKNGNIGNVKVLRGIGGGCDEEAIRVVKLMPAWKPGRQNGKSVPVYFTLPIRFQLKE